MACSLQQIAHDFFEVIQLTNAPGTVANYRRHINNWLKSVEGKSVEDLRAIDLLRWGKTWHQIQAVQRLFAWAVDDAELLQRHPFRRVKKPPLGERRRTLSRKQFLTIARGAGRCFRNFLLAMRESIARPQEIRALCWEHLHAQGEGQSLLNAAREGQACFVLAEYKARKRRKDPTRPRIILVSPRLGRLLTRLATQTEILQGPVFLNSKGQAWTANAVRLRMRTLRRQLQLPADARGENIVAYTVRHTQATAAAAAGVRDRILAELMGHTSTRTTARYQHLDIEHLRTAFQSLRCSSGKGG